MTALFGFVLGFTVGFVLGVLALMLIIKRENKARGEGTRMEG